MPIPLEALDRIAGLASQLSALQEAVELVVTAEQTDAGSSLTKGQAVSSLEDATRAWLEASGAVESLLQRYLPTDEPEESDGRLETGTDALERLGGLALVHLAAAADIAKLDAIDVLSDDDPVSAAAPVLDSDRQSVIQSLAGEGPTEGQIMRYLSLSRQNADDADGLIPEVPPSVASEDVLAQLVDMASDAVHSVLIGSAPSPHVVFLAIRPALEEALSLAPAAIQAAAGDVVRSIVRLAKWLLHRAHDVIMMVARRQAEIIGDLLKKLPDDLIVRPIVTRVVSGLLGEREIRNHLIVARRQYRGREHAYEVQHHLPRKPVVLPDNSGALKEIIKRNKRWVGRPVPIVARKIHPLWAVPIGPIPAAPIAAYLLLAWTILVTGDQLDTSGFPDFWHPGVGNLI